MDFVDRDRRIEPVLPGTLGYPRRVAPRIVLHVCHDGTAPRAQLRAKSIRVGLQREWRAVARQNLVFVDHPFCDARNKQLPDPGRTTRPHSMNTAVPMIEVADHADASCVWRPHREVHTAYAL